MKEGIRDFLAVESGRRGAERDFSDEAREAAEDFFKRDDNCRYAKDARISASFDRIDFIGKKILEINLGQGADAERIVRRGGIYSGVDSTAGAEKKVKIIK